jgi:hypothetical protein
MRYTLQGPDEVESRIARDQAVVAMAVRDVVPAQVLAALVLAGGYGRGEGGFRWSGGRAVPYNDYDYFLVVRGVARNALAGLRETVQALAARLGRELAIEVDFALLEEERLPRLPACLMYSELKWRSRTLLGDAAVLDAIPSPAVGDLPLAEYSRMMLNRGALLLMNAQALRDGGAAGPADVERFLRYFSKGILAAGDARLAAARQYQVPTTERRRALAQMDWHGHERFMALYELATRIRFGGADVGEAQRRNCAYLQRRVEGEWLAAYRLLEATRLRCEFGNWEHYASPAIGKGQATQHWLAPAHHLWLALSREGPALLRTAPIGWLRHPRERLMAALPLLLEARCGSKPSLATRLLGAPSDAGIRALTGLFLDRWYRYC